MKKIQNKIKFINFLIFLFSFFWCKSQTLFYNNGPIYVADYGNIAIKGDTNANNIIDFGTGSVKTSKGPNHGIFHVINQTQYVNQNENNIDGFINAVITNGSYIFPLADQGSYAPIKVESQNTILEVTTAYFKTNPQIEIGNNFSNSITDISNNEYWEININNQLAKLSLSWNNSSQLSNLFLNNNELYQKLTIVGWNGNEWIVIPSQIDLNSFNTGNSSNLTNGSITSAALSNLNNFSKFSLGVKLLDCNVIFGSLSSSATNWTSNGWTNGAPTIFSDVIIQAPYQGDSFFCNSITLNDDVTLNDTNFIEIINGAYGNGKIILESQASLLQRNSNAPAPSIILRKKSRPMRKFDYVYWGTPIAGNFFNQIPLATALNYNTSAFDFLFKYQTGNGGGWQTLTNTETGYGFITRIKSQAPFINNAQSIIQFNFDGIANNGDIQKNISYNPFAIDAPSSYNLLANPYPSAIDAQSFLTQNNSIGGAIYLWSSATFNETGTNAYSQADYAVWNLSGGVATSPISQLPSGIIASGQGFKVKGIANGTVTFNNCMRLAEGNTNFFRTANENIHSSNETPSKIWLALKSDNQPNLHSEILIAYLSNATYNYDRLYDADRNSVSDAQLYTLQDSKKLAINGRPSFEITDEVPLGISKSNSNSNNSFKISLIRMDGLFQNSNMNVFIYDQYLNIYHNLNNNDYSFTSNSSEINDRFKIVYQNSSLSNNESENSSATAFIKDDKLYLESFNDLVSDIAVYDIKGSFIFSSKNILNNSSNSYPFNHSNGIYIIKINFTSGKKASLKLIK